MVTAEIAVAVPVLFLLAATFVTAARAVVVKERCLDAARETVRAAARGEPDPDQVGRRVAPAGAGITLTADGDTVTAKVSVPLKPFGISLPDMDVDASATGTREDAVPAGEAAR